MMTQLAHDEYLRALKAGQKEYKALIAADKDPSPAVLDALLAGKTVSTRELGILEIPINRIVGTVNAGRTGAFTAGFCPLLPPDSEFATKWIALCRDHLEAEGIRDPILVREYLGNFYVQEGNKRVSVLKHFGAPGIFASVTRVLPPKSEDPRIRAYYEFVQFYEDTGLYQIQFRKPGDYALLLSYLGKAAGEKWDDRERRTFQSYFRYFRNALESQGKDFAELLPEEALLQWLKVYPFQDLGRLTAAELKKTVAGLKAELKKLAEAEPVQVQLAPTDAKSSILNLLLPIKAEYVRVAFVHALSPESSEWIAAHDRGREYLEKTLGSQVHVRTYCNADGPAQAEATLEKAVADGAEIVFTTTPQLARSALRMAVKYPKVKFLNCAANVPYASIRSYYGRMYEAKFITGAIAGAMADGNRIGYIGASPIWGELASINAFALGAQLTNPRAKVVLRWSCLPGRHEEDFFREDIRVISNREMPLEEEYYLDGYSYGLYVLDEDQKMLPLAMPIWGWGKFYEAIVRSVIGGTWDKDKQSAKAVNYWWGLSTGMIDIRFTEHLPEGIAVLACQLLQDLKDGTIQPFRRRILSQDGTVKNDGTVSFTPEQLLGMDWLCENVEGHIPEFEELGHYARPLVREQGIYLERIPKEKEGSL